MLTCHSVQAIPEHYAKESSDFFTLQSRSIPFSAKMELDIMPLVFFSSDCILISGDEDTSQMYALHKPVRSKVGNSMQSQ